MLPIFPPASRTDNLITDSCSLIELMLLIQTIFYTLFRCQMHHLRSGTVLDIPQSNPTKISILKHNWPSSDRRDVNLSKCDHCEYVVKQFNSCKKLNGNLKKKYRNQLQKQQHCLDF